MSKNKHSDKDIINGIVTVAPEIYEYLDKMYREEVIQHVRRNSGSTEDGEEHYQDVIFEIYLNIDGGRYGLNTPKTFDQYFWMLVKRRWIDQLRKKGGGISTTELDELTMQIANKDEAEEIADDLYNRLILAINRYLKELSAEEQKYIELFYFARASLQTIADYFGTTYDYARVKLDRIRKKLRKRIDDDPEFGTLLYI